MTTIYEQAISEWGIDAQLDMCIEECAELIQAISKIKRIKYLKHNNPDKIMITQKRVDNLKEELADVQLMVNQLATMYDFSLESYLAEEALKEKLANA